MATQLKKTVKPSGGDYTSLEACMNANEKDLVAADQYFDVEIDGDWSGGADTTNCTIHNYTTDAMHYINIYTTAAARHAGVWNDSKYRKTTGGGGQLINEQAINYVSIKGIQFDAQGGYAIFIGNSGTNITIAYNIIKNASYDSTTPGISLNYYGPHFIYNNIIYECGKGISSPGQFAINGIVVFNNTVADCVTAGIDFQATQYSSPKPLLKNNLVQNSVTNFPNPTGLDPASNYNASSDTTSTGGANDRTSQTFTFKDAANKDYHLASTDAGARNYGVSDPGSGLFSDDIDGETRSGSWDIGADEYVAAGGSALKFRRGFSTRAGTRC
jgi:hypothetical protein